MHNDAILRKYLLACLCVCVVTSVGESPSLGAKFPQYLRVACWGKPLSQYRGGGRGEGRRGAREGGSYIMFAWRPPEGPERFKSVPQLQFSQLLLDLLAS